MDCEIKRAKTIKYAQIDAFFAVLIFPSVLACLSMLFKICNLAELFNSVIFYALLFCYLLSKVFKINSFKYSDLIAAVVFFTIFGLFYLCSSSAEKPYYGNMDIIVMLCLYIPFAIFVVKKTVDWRLLVKDDKYSRAATVLIFVSFVLKILDKANVRTDYMPFSYDMLPVWGLVALVAVLRNKKSLWIVTVLSVFECLFFGARGAIVFLVVLILCVKVVQIMRGKNAMENMLVLGVALAIALALMVIALIILTTFLDTRSSYLISRLINGTFTGDSGRSKIYSECIKIISNMGFSIKGPFYERTILEDNVYAHNLFLEMFISLGWIGGSIACMLVIGLIVRAFYEQRNSSNLYMLLWIVFTVFARFLLSGSIYDEGRFWLSLAVIYSLVVNNQICFSRRRKQKPQQRRR